MQTSGQEISGVAKNWKPEPNMPPESPVTGVALGGGGAKGSFQLGALKYLYERVFGRDEPLPTVMSGTSVGAVNATKLAEGGKAAFANLENIWMSLQRSSDMYLEHDWFITLTQFQKDVLNKLAAGGTYGFAVLLGFLTDFPIGFPFQEVFSIGDKTQIRRALGNALGATAIHHLGPLAKLIDNSLDVDKVLKSQIKLRLAVVNLHEGQLRYVTEAGKLLERDNRTEVRWPGAVGKGSWGLGDQSIPQTCRGVADKVAQAIKAIPKPERDLKGHPDPVGMAEYEKAVGEALKPLHECLKKHSQVRLKEGVLASSAIPLVFEPGRIFGTRYVDGGVREVVPVQVAIDCGASKVYAILCAREESAPGPALDNLMTIGLRALDITLDEITLNETSRVPAWADKPVVLIRPRFEVHDALTIEPGLIRISAAYGYMCAADTVELEGRGPEMWNRREEAKALADKITRYRLAHWHSETGLANSLEAVKNKATRPEDGHMAALGKNDVRLAAKERLAKGYALPPHIERAWMSWECHRLAQFYPVLWPEFGLGNLPEACKELKKRLDGLEKRRREVVDALAKDTSRPQKGGRPQLNEQDVKQLDKEIDDARALLTQCIGSTPLDSRSHGLLIKAFRPPTVLGKGSKELKEPEEIYILYGGSKLLLRGADPMNEMKYDRDDVLEVPEETLARLPKDRPADGTVLGNLKGDVFIMQGGKKKRFTITAPKFYDPAKYDPNFTPLEKEAREIRLVPAETLNNIP